MCGHLRRSVRRLLPRRWRAEAVRTGYLCGGERWSVPVCEGRRVSQGARDLVLLVCVRCAESGICTCCFGARERGLRKVYAARMDDSERAQSYVDTLAAWEQLGFLGPRDSRCRRVPASVEWNVGDGCFRSTFQIGAQMYSLPQTEWEWFVAGGLGDAVVLRSAAVTAVSESGSAARVLAAPGATRAA